MDQLLVESLQKIVGVGVSEDVLVSLLSWAVLVFLTLLSTYVGSLAQSCDTQAAILDCTAQELHPAIDALLAGLKRGVVDQLCRRLPPTDPHPPFSLECVRP